MNLTSPTQVKGWCIEHGFHPNKTLGQNFLVDANALEGILDAAGPLEGRTVLEIGPGLGVLTEGLLRRGAKVHAVEKDETLAARLQSGFGALIQQDSQNLEANQQNGRCSDSVDSGSDSVHPVKSDRIEIVCADALDEIAAGRCDGYGTLVSNLPYQAGTRILLDLILREAARPETMVVLMQTEVAQRLAATERDGKRRGVAGVLAQLDYDVRCVREVPPTCFWPRPEVGSTVARLVRHHRNDGLPQAVRDNFRRIVKRAFEHRRKQLGTIFKSLRTAAAGAESSSEGVAATLHSLHTLRPEQLTNDQWLQLAAAPLS